jgi:hypothetical protein
MLFEVAVIAEMEELHIYYQWSFPLKKLIPEVEWTIPALYSVLATNSNGQFKPFNVGVAKGKSF